MLAPASVVLAVVLALSGASFALAQPAEGRGRTGAPAHTIPPGARHQMPAFPGQTRAPQPEDAAAVSVEGLADGLPPLWAMEVLPDGRLLVTAKAGALHVMRRGGTLGPAIEGVPEVDPSGQGGLLDVALAPDFADTGMILLSYSEPRGAEGNGTSVARGTLVLDEAGAGRLEDVAVIFRQTPAYAGDKHFGSRLAFAPDGTVFVTVGERSGTPIRDRAQDLTAGMGKIFRIRPDGTSPADNPFVGHAAIQPEIWSYGHRNVQSAVIDDDGRLWTVEHGPRGGDELNRPRAGRNYGWPVITYGVAYSGRPVGAGRTQMPGMEQPVYYWDPVIAPSGMAQYRDEAIREWQGAFLIGGLVSRGLVVLHLDGDRVASEERVALGARVRDVRVGSDGAVYALTDGRDGTSEILRIVAEARAPEAPQH